MSAVLDQAQELVRNRISEIDEERTKLSRALDALSSKPSPRRRSRAAKAGRPRRAGTRAEEAIKLIAANPNISAAEIAKTMKIKSNYLYRVLGDLEKQKRVRKEGRNYFPV